MKRLAVSILSVAATTVCLAQEPTSGQAPKTPATTPAVQSKPVPPIRNEVIDTFARLREEREALLREKTEVKQQLSTLQEMTGERAQLRVQLQELMQKLGSKPTPIPAAHGTKHEVGSAHAEASKNEPAPTDAVSLGRVLYTSKDYDGALRSLRMVEMDDLPKQDRAFARYLTASCLRRLGKHPESSSAYREVADAKEDDFMSECAIKSTAPSGFFASVLAPS